MLSVLFGISTALCWGTADFIGGATSRRVGAFGMTLGTIAGGLLLLLPVAFARNEALMPPTDWLLSMVAGAFGAVGILLLYLSMTTGRLSLAAPVAALTSAALPVVFGMVTQGLPDAKVLAGLVLALGAVWLVSQSADTGRSEEPRSAGLGLPLLAGSFMGAFLILMHAGSAEALLWPMVAVRCGGVATLLLLLSLCKSPAPVGRREIPWRLFLLNALLDVAGNGFFILAGQTGRMDVAAVLSSLFPGTTVLLAWLLLKEKLARPQLAGILLALGAIVLLAL